MPDIPFDGLPPAEFAGLRFAVARVRMSCGTRYHLHQYPHSPGADIEKLGRRPYTVQMSCLFHENLPGYPRAWSLGLPSIRQICETEQTAKLVVPNVGGILAYCVNWTQDADFRVRSGESVDLEFIEDQSRKYLFDDIEAHDAAQVSAMSASLDAALLAQYKEEAQPSLFDDIRNAVDAVIATRDQADLYGQLVESKVSALADLCGEADRTIDIFSQPDNYRVMQALHDLWAAAVDLASDVAVKATPIRSWQTPPTLTMNIGQVATAIYGDQTRTTDILQLNEFDDVFAIRPGTVVRYYADTTGAVQVA